MSNAARDLLRHTLATLAYRGGKAVRDVPESVARLRVAEGSRTLLEILAHVNDLLDWGAALCRGEHRWQDSTPTDWSAETARFHAGLATLEAYLVTGDPLGFPAERVFQGPIADALTHVGQIAYLRRLAGAPIRGESYFRADIVAGRVGREQTAPVREFD